VFAKIDAIEQKIKYRDLPYYVSISLFQVKRAMTERVSAQPIIIPMKKRNMRFTFL